MPMALSRPAPLNTRSRASSGSSSTSSITSSPSRTAHRTLPCLISTGSAPNRSSPRMRFLPRTTLSKLRNLDVDGHQHLVDFSLGSLTRHHGRDSLDVAPDHFFHRPPNGRKRRRQRLVSTLLPPVLRGSRRLFRTRGGQYCERNQRHIRRKRRAPATIVIRIWKLFHLSPDPP